MLTSRFPERWLAKLLALLFASLIVACGSVPEPAPAPAPEPAPVAEQAAAEPEPAAEQEPEPVDFNQQFYAEAVSALKKGDTGAAIELLLQVSAEAPDKPYVFTNLGLAYFKTDQLELAEQAFQQAIARNSRDAVAHNHLGILQRQKGQFDQARESYERAISIDRGYALAHLNLGILFDIYLQDLGQALRHYQQYQSLAREENSQVAGWILDIERQLKAAPTGSQG